MGFQKYSFHLTYITDKKILSIFLLEVTDLLNLLSENLYERFTSE